MSGTAESVREPKDDAEWARDIDRRTGGLENATSVRVGQWVLATSDDGHLIASHVEGGAQILARKPPPGETDPDAISDAAPSVTLVRTEAQAIPANGATVMWDGVLSEVGGDWTSGQRTLESVEVPVSGVYLLMSTLHWGVGAIAATTGIKVDDETRLAGRYVESSNIPWPSSIAAGTLPLQAGQSVSVIALPGAARAIGGSTLGTPVIPSMLSVFLIART